MTALARPTRGCSSLLLTSCAPPRNASAGTARVASSGAAASGGLFGSSSSDGSSGGVLGGGLFGGSRPIDQENEQDPLLEPVTAAAIMMHMRVTEMTAPTMLIKKSLLLMTMCASKDIRAWRSTAVRMGKYTQQQADAIDNKQEIFDALMADCPFA